MIGKTLGNFECTALLGKGGMGEVYRAKDQKLGREVAIKVLPEEFAKDADRVARFQREAKLLASLNHPNIAAIHGLEESDGTHFLVLELIEGDTLADRLKRGSMPVEEALKLAFQISEALEAAHEKGVIHRDLKPANIKVTPDGKVKVLDFGLAKAFAGDQEDMILSDSPTLSEAATQKGVILGTAAYMSPEQARGKTVDKRADIWAFGVVLFEMLTGQSLFAGGDVSQTLARVLERQPDYSVLTPNLHPRIRLLLERCLEKEAKDRYGSISDARVDVQKALADPRGVLVQPVATPEPQTKLPKILPWIAAIVLTAIIIGLVSWTLKPTLPPESLQVNRFYYELREDQQFSNPIQPVLAVSPNGRQFIFSTSKGLYLRSMDEFEARIIPGTEEEPQQPFFSPDGQWVGYWSVRDRQLKRIAASGGVPVPITDIPAVAFIRWGADDTIIYVCDEGIVRVSAKGGDPKLLVAAGSDDFFSPQLLPDGRSLLFTLSTNEGYKIVAQSLESGERKELFQGDTAQYLSTGHIVYISENDLFAIPFDPDKLEPTGSPVLMVEGILRAIGVPQYAVSESGSLTYIPTTTGTTSPQRTLVWVDREGREEVLKAPPDEYLNAQISPDGTRVALTVGIEANYGIRIWDLIRKNLTRPTVDDVNDHVPLWTPDSQRIAFYSQRSATSGIHWMNADGTGKVELLFRMPGRSIAPQSWSDNGKTLLVTSRPRAYQNYDIGSLSVEGDRVYKPLLQQEHAELLPQISPDGRWMAYMSNESGQDEIYVRSYPDVNNVRQQVSTSGGTEPRWSPDGRELFYRSRNAVMVALVKTEPIFSLETPEILFRGNFASYTLPLAEGGLPYFTWDISPDGKRFLMIKESTGDATTEEESPPRINIVLNWFEELKERVAIE